MGSVPNDLLASIDSHFSAPETAPEILLPMSVVPFLDSIMQHGVWERQSNVYNVNDVAMWKEQLPRLLLCFLFTLEGLYH